MIEVLRQPAQVHHRQRAGVAGTSRRSRDPTTRRCCWRRRARSRGRAASASTSIGVARAGDGARPSGSASASSRARRQPLVIAPQRARRARGRSARPAPAAPAASACTPASARRRPTRPARPAPRPRRRRRAAAAECGAAGRAADRATPARCASGRCAAAGRRRRAARRACRSTKLCTSSSAPSTNAGFGRPRSRICVERGFDRDRLRPAQHAGRAERARPREAAGHVVFEQAAIEAERDAELERVAVGRGVEPAGPESGHRVIGGIGARRREPRDLAMGFVSSTDDLSSPRTLRGASRGAAARAVARDDEDRVVAGDGADRFRQLRAVDGHRRAAAPGRRRSG